MVVEATNTLVLLEYKALGENGWRKRIARKWTYSCLGLAHGALALWIVEWWGQMLMGELEEDIQDDQLVFGVWLGEVGVCWMVVCYWGRRIETSAIQLFPGSTKVLRNSPSLVLKLSAESLGHRRQKGLTEKKKQGRWLHNRGRRGRGHGSLQGRNTSSSLCFISLCLPLPHSFKHKLSSQ
jgi:hypothetical protein